MVQRLEVTLLSQKRKVNILVLYLTGVKNRDHGQWAPLSIAFFLGRMATWNYVVVTNQYRGNDEGEGKEEFGGKDINDVLNLIPV